MTRSPFLVNVADLARPSARPRSLAVETPVEWVLELSRTLPSPPLTATLRLARMSGGLLVTGSVDVAVEHVCHRCLQTTRDDLHVTVGQLYATPGVDDDAEYELVGDEIDLEPMIRDEVLLAMPLLPTCGDDCPGPPHETGVVDESEAPGSPFAVLEGLFDDD